MNKIFTKLRHSFSARLSFFILLFTVTIFVVAFSVFYQFSSRSIERNARTESENILQKINLQIEKVLRRVETVPNNLNWIIASGVILPDSMYSITQNVVRNNPDIYGSAIAFEPNYFKEKGYYFSPYSYKDNNTIRSLQLGGSDYDYFNWEWYSQPKKYGIPCWSEPYFDKGGGQMVMCTYSAPIYDKNRELIGVFTSDISLEWLTEMINNMKHNEHSSIFLLSKDGTFIVHEQHEFILNKTIFALSEEKNEPQIKALGEQMIAGKQGMQVLDVQKENSFVFYAPVPHTKWSLGIVLPSDEVFGDLHRINWLLFFIIGSGLIVLFFISFQMISNLTKLQRTTAVKEKIESELRIARNIQMGMLPKITTPFSARKELDLYAVLTPAKEIGGDLYDFFLEEDNLYFAIGDVAGYGIPASLFMAVTLRLFRSIAVRTETPAEIMSSLNNSIAENNDSNLFVTLFIGKLNLNTGILKYCNAGHNSPVLITPNGACECLQVVPNLPVGVMKEFHYIEQCITLPATSALLLYTDGVTEAENANKELYGAERMLETIKQNPKASPREMIVNLLSDINLHIKENESSDDITLLAIKYSGTKLIISNKIEELYKVTEFIEQMGLQLGLSPALTMNLNLALEEAISNVIQYGYRQKAESRKQCRGDLHGRPMAESNVGATFTAAQWQNGEDELIEITAELIENKLILTLTDCGDEFDPTLIEAPDITLSADERPVGGLGFFLIRQIMNEVEYRRVDNKNVLTMSKILST